MKSSVFLSDLLTAHEPSSELLLVINDFRRRFMRSLDLHQWMRIGTLSPLGRVRLLPSPNFRPQIRDPRERRPTRFRGGCPKNR